MRVLGGLVYRSIDVFQGFELLFQVSFDVHKLLA